MKKHIGISHYNSIAKRYPAVIDAIEAVGQVVRHSGPLDDVTAQLVQLAAAAAMHSEGAVHSHVRRALNSGASPEQVRHTVLLLTSTIGFPGMMAALSWADDVLDAEKGRRKSTRRDRVR